MRYVIGIDLGTSGVKLLLVNEAGEVCQEVSRSYPLLQEKDGHCEQDPELWVKKTTEALAELVSAFPGRVEEIEGLSFSGQMHGLVLLDEQQRVLRHAILWNDTRTTEQCRFITERIGEETLLQLAKNRALEGFTLPKLLWVKQHEPELFRQAKLFLLPKDYLRFRLTGKLNSEYSDAAGTLLLEVGAKRWSPQICEQLDIPLEICPPLVESHACVGTITAEIAEMTGLAKSTKVFAGGADNACGAIGAGVLAEGKTLCSIGTSGVVLAYERSADVQFAGQLHCFDHAEEAAYYSMGVTLAAGHSLSWFRETFAETEKMDHLLARVGEVPIGANGLLFTPYITGERTPHADAAIRGSFIGIDSKHTKADFARAVMEGITFSLKQTIELLQDSGKPIREVVAIGGGAKNAEWLQMQADIFQTDVVKLSSEQGPALGAAMIAAYGCGWFASLQACADRFLQVVETYRPIADNVQRYRALYQLYKQVYDQTKDLSHALARFRA
ncbi:xylulokinase [Brevibacillus fulvus]|uniref:Xylulose kinase n=1 Tax=Brevibacillus fulvus TaxID=1125967 RepID=A0A938XYY9_9BACL|nr:xylulokinase [Brevibacillus fulvus]MBM7588462.1 xylulokinase [Brevibacillus fulvus]